MSEKLNAAFIFLAGGAGESSRAVVQAPGVALHVVGVGTYSEACIEAAKLVQEQGVTAVELCAGFGNEGLAMVQRAVGSGVAVGAVRFDMHPGLGFKSGDSAFNQ